MSVFPRDRVRFPLLCLSITQCKGWPVSSVCHPHSASGKHAKGQVSHTHTCILAHPSHLPGDLCFSWCVLQSLCSAGISWHKAPKATAFLLNHRRANPLIYLSSYDAPFLPVKAVSSPKKNENSSSFTQRYDISNLMTLIRLWNAEGDVLKNVLVVLFTINGVRRFQAFIKVL